MKTKKVWGIVLAIALSCSVVQPVPLGESTVVQAATKKKAKKPVMNKKKVTLTGGKKTKLKLKHAKAKKVKWKSSNKKIATVKKGIVKAKREGKVKITATYQGKKYKVRITVKAKKTKKQKYTWKTETISTLQQGVKLLDFAEDGKNILFSPLSLNIALGMATNGATNDAKKELEQYLGSSVTDYNKHVAALMKQSELSESLNLANGIWYKKGYSLKSAFEKTMGDSYKAELKAADLNQNTVDEINAWADQKTDGMIKKIVEELDPYSRAVLVNALYFKAKWTKPFKKSMIEKKDFTQFSGTKKKVDMMCDEESVYYENDQATGFEKTYEEGAYSFIAILPKKKGTFALKDLNLEAFLETKTKKYAVDIELPKFSYDWNSEGKLVKFLKANGVSTMFDDKKNPLGNILETMESIYADDVIQATRIELDEEGTKAAAVTAIIAKATSALEKEKPPRKQVYLNRPFAYMIVDNLSGQVMFMGKVVTIEQ
jgi:serpin B